jgi:hypothetical protein
MLTFPAISIPISSKTWFTIASCSSSSPDSSRTESRPSFTKIVKKNGMQLGLKYHIFNVSAIPPF